MVKSARGVDAELVVHEFLDYLDTKYGVDREELSRLISKKEEEPAIPIEILSNRMLGPMEAVVKFLRENNGLSYTRISELVGRSRSTIGVMYRNAGLKLSAKFLNYPSSIYAIPISLLARQKYTALEAVVMFLRGKELRVCQIAGLLNRDYRTIYTIYRRGKRKDEA